MIVVDASVLLPAVAEAGEVGRTARDRIGSRSMVAPELIDCETASALKGLERSGRLSPDLALLKLRELALLPIERVPHWPFLVRIWELRHNLSVYDATYVAVAEALGTPLVTADSRIANSPVITCEVELLSVA
ncbi:MAG: type II toxin-antitoxin system VapC family toxin [Solirubrobacterales bacterium]|nr:type II toxin-antitoxin system VapC family toxin [Solirubrobacterales bacterium]